MAHDWNELTRLTHGAPVVVERVRMQETGIAIEGSFELPPLARLSMEDQVFVMAFVQRDGSIKDMEHTFGISYPTVKSRLARIAGQLRFVEIKQTSSQDDVLTRLEQGEISAEEAIERLSK
jgi:hypothetical protein